MDRHHRALNVYEVVLTQTVLTLALPADNRPAAYTNIVPHIQSPRTASSTCRASAPKSSPASVNGAPNLT